MFFEQKVSRTSICSDEFVIWSARKLFLINNRVLNLPEKFSEKPLRKTIPNRYNIEHTTYCQVESTENHQCITTGA